MRKRKRILSPETCAKRCAIMYSLDSYDLELERMVKFSVAFAQRCHHETLFENSFSWRRVRGACKLAECYRRITL